MNRFDEFCTTIQDDAGAPRLSPLPASPATILAYMGFLAEEGKVKASSLQSYLSAINSAHADFGFDKPAQGHWIILARRGFEEIEGARHQKPTTATPFPSAFMLAILTFGLLEDTADVHVRECACLAAQFAFFSRADSGCLLLVKDVLVHGDTFSINASAKNIGRIQAAPLSRLTSTAARHDPGRLFQRLQEKWKLIRQHTHQEALYWLFDGEALPSSPTVISTWLSRIMKTLDIPIPPGVSYTGHSLRRGGASAAHAINVSLPMIVHWGLWKDASTALSYIDVTIQPDEGAFVFFSNLLPRTG
jgi:hypothetical protein